MTIKKRKDTGTSKIALCGELAVEEAMDLS
jgi:hypothetical protein